MTRDQMTAHLILHGWEPYVIDCLTSGICHIESRWWAHDLGVGSWDATPRMVIVDWRSVPDRAIERAVTRFYPHMLMTENARMQKGLP